MPSPLLYAAVFALLPGILGEAKALHQDPWTMAAIVFTESRGVTSAVKHENDGSCSVGAAGINVPGCEPSAVNRLLYSQANLHAEAVILSKGAVWCRAHRSTKTCRRGGAVAQYNAGDPGYVARVRTAAKKIKRAWLLRTRARARADGAGA